jgi:hypothetical protein
MHQNFECGRSLIFGVHKHALLFPYTPLPLATMNACYLVNVINVERVF